MPALAEIKKKPQRQLPEPKKGKGGGVVESRPLRPGESTPVHLIRELVRLHELYGVPYRRAYFKVFPERRATEKSGGEIAKRLIDRYKTQYIEELAEMLRLHGLTEERLAVELDLRLKANTLREIVKSKIVKPKAEKKGMPAKPPFVLTTRDTEEVEDNATRMRATELLADVHGARKVPAGGGVQQNVGIIYVVGGKIMKKRQERIV
jgi:hypothetical protein